MTPIKPDKEQEELILAFVEEGRELLDEAEPLLIELEKKSNQSGKLDSEVINTIFRLFHSLKGGAGFLDLDTVGKVTHEAETLLDIFRKGKAVLRGEHIDLLNVTCDFIRKLLDNIESEFTDKGFEDESGRVIENLQQTILSVTEDSQGVLEKSRPERSFAKVDATMASDSNQDTASAESQASSSVEESLDDLQLTITPEIIKEFTTESEELLASAEDALLNLEKEPNNAEYIADAFRALHSFKGNAGFLGYVDLERLSHQGETVLDKIRCGEISGDSEIFSLLLEILDFLRDGISKINEGKEPKIIGIAGVINIIQDAVKKLEKSDNQTVEDTGQTVPDNQKIPDKIGKKTKDSDANLKVTKIIDEKESTKLNGFNKLTKIEGGKMNDQDPLETTILEEEENENTQDGKYLTFILRNQEYGIEIRNVIEIIGIQNITDLPDTPNFVKGVINLRGKVIPVIEVRLRFQFEEKEYNERTCIIVVNIDNMQVGLIVDTVSEVLDIPAESIEPPPKVNKGSGSRFILGLGKVGENVKILLELEKLLFDNEVEQIADSMTA